MNNLGVGAFHFRLIAFNAFHDDILLMNMSFTITILYQ